MYLWDSTEQTVQGKPVGLSFFDTVASFKTHIHIRRHSKAYVNVNVKGILYLEEADKNKNKYFENSIWDHLEALCAEFASSFFIPL